MVSMLGHKTLSSVRYPALFDNCFSDINSKSFYRKCYLEFRSNTFSQPELDFYFNPNV